MILAKWSLLNINHRSISKIDFVMDFRKCWKRLKINEKIFVSIFPTLETPYQGDHHSTKNFTISKIDLVMNFYKCGKRQKIDVKSMFRSMDNYNDLTKVIIIEHKSPLDLKNWLCDGPPKVLKTTENQRKNICFDLSKIINTFSRWSSLN